MLPDLPVLKGEEIRHIQDFPGYAVTDKGRVFSCRSQSGKYGYWYVCSPRVMKDDRKDIRIIKDGKYTAFKVAVLVLTAFKGDKLEGLVACHNDGDCSNDELSNLRWDTYQSNTADSYKHGTAKFGESHCNNKLTEQEVEDIFIRRLQGESSSKLAEEYDVTRGNISCIMRGDSWKHLKLHERLK